MATDTALSARTQTAAELVTNADAWLRELDCRPIHPDTAEYALYRLCAQLTAALHMIIAERQAERQ